MSAAEFLSHLRSLGVKLWADGERLRCNAPKAVLTPELRAELENRKLDILGFLNDANGVTDHQEGEEKKLQVVARDGEIPLSFAQERLWFLDQLEPGSPLYNIPLALRLIGQLDQNVLERSLSEIVRRHEALRTTFRALDGRPVQVINPALMLELPVVDLRELPGRERENELQRLIGKEARRPFDLSSALMLRTCVFRLSKEEHVLLLTMHHIASDGWSIGILFQELSVLYEGFSTGRPSPLAELPIQYADYAVWQRQCLQGKFLDEQLSYWKRQLAGAPPGVDFPTDRPRPPIQSYRGARHSIELPQSLSGGLKELSRREGVSLYMVLLAAFQTLLYRCTGQPDIIVGTPVAGRNRSEIEGLIGFFINTLALRTNLSGNPTFVELLGRVRDISLEAYAHQDLPFEKLVEELQPERDLSRHPIFQIFFNLLNFQTHDLKLKGLKVEDLAQTTEESKFDLTLYVNETEKAILLTLVYNIDLFHHLRMIEFLEQYKLLLYQIVDDPDAKILSFSLITAKARTLLPDPAQPLSSEWFGAVHLVFSEQAERCPNRLCLHGTQSRWTYEELESRSNRLANYLIGNGIRTGDVIAVYGNRAPSLVCAILGILKSGACFLILDPVYPPGRLLKYLRIAEPKAWIAVEAPGGLPDDLQSFLADLPLQVQLEVSDSAVNEDLCPFMRETDARPCVNVGPDDPAYVAFTSGTQGEPKAILGTHGPLSHFLRWHCQTFGLADTDRFCMLSGLSHDPLLRDIFTPLCLGATLYIPDAELLPGRDLVKWMAQYEISVAHLTPALADSMTDIPDSTGSKKLSLRFAFFGGDVLMKHHVTKIRSLAPSVRCINFYGATETPQAMSYLIVPPEQETHIQESQMLSSDIVPLGRPVDGVQLLILNAAGQLCGVGELGEIHIRTPYLAKGYLKAEALTSERFLVNPFTGSSRDRMYRTGDFGCYAPDGLLTFAGRHDRQVKIRGFRVELAEVEAVLEEHPTVDRCAVHSYDYNPGDRRFVAYVVSRETVPSTDDLRSFLRKKLPEYMVPSSFVLMESLPLTPNGKVDWRALPPLDQDRPELEQSFTSPRTELETMIAGIWQELLGVGPIGVHDSFFDLGGHSLLAIRVISRIRSSFKIDIPLRTIFDNPRVAELAIQVAQAQTRRITAAVTDVLTDVEAVSDEEAMGLLTAE